jgi:hypothetical protein
LSNGRKRIVLSDWDLSAKPPRADVLRIRQSSQSATGGLVVERLTPAQACVTARIDER